ncbi:MAG: hypothetical protein ACTSPY_08110 [Candidatus Helarchaeota archaeon]
MTNVRIPKSIKEILDLFIMKNFSPLTIQDISMALKIDSNTIAQRINRNEKFFEVIKKRPKKIIVKPGINEIIFYRDKNQCQICRKTLPQRDLMVRTLNPNLNNRDKYTNLITTCLKCQNKPIPKHSRKRKKNLNQKMDLEYIWEYKQIQIAKRIGFRGEHLSPFPQIYYNMNLGIYQENDINTYTYYEFNELDGKGWFYFTNDENENEITSLKLIDIINEFGNDGWELVFMREIPGKIDSEKNPFLIPGGFLFSNLKWSEEFECIFKRKKRK